MIDKTAMESLWWLAERLQKACVFTSEVTSVDKAFAILLAGEEMGFSPMASARSIALVKGKVSLGADAQIGLCKRSSACRYFYLVESTELLATYITHREGDPEATSLTYTMEMARTAGLAGSQTWRSHPKAMLRARGGAALARAVYPDVVGGIYDPDEADEIRRGGPAQHVAPAAATAAVDARRVEALPSEPIDGISEYLAAVEAITLPGEAVAVWAKHRAELAALGSAGQDAAWRAICARVEITGKIKSGKVWLKKALAEEYARANPAPVAREPGDDDDQPDPPAGGTTTKGTRAASGNGSSVATAPTAGAQALRVVLDSDAHVPFEGTWRETEAGWHDHLAGMTVRRRVEASVACNGGLLGGPFIAMAAERIVAIDSERPRPAGVARLTAIGVGQTLERIALDASRERAALAQRAVAA